MSTIPVVEPMMAGEFRRLRESLGLSQHQLAVALGKTAQTIYNWESSEDPLDPTAALAIRKLFEDGRKTPKRAKR